MVNKYSTLVTARRREEIYPPHIHYLGYDRNHEFVGFFSWSKEENQVVEVTLEDDEEVTPEKIVQSLSDLIAERDALKSELAKKQSSVDTSAMEKRVMCSFSIRGDDPEFVYGLYSRKDAEALVKRQRDVYGENAITDVDVHEYHIVWKN